MFVFGFVAGTWRRASAGAPFSTRSLVESDVIIARRRVATRKTGMMVECASMCSRLSNTDIVASFRSSDPFKRVECFGLVERMAVRSERQNQQTHWSKKTSSSSRRLSAKTIMWRRARGSPLFLAGSLAEKNVIVPLEPIKASRTGLVLVSASMLCHRARLFCRRAALLACRERDAEGHARGSPVSGALIGCAPATMTSRDFRQGSDPCEVAPFTAHDAAEGKLGRTTQ